MARYWLGGRSTRIQPDFPGEEHAYAADRDVVRQGAVIFLHEILNRLSGVDFWSMHLSKANLAGVDLSNAHLEGAILTEADLEGADLRGTFASGMLPANFELACLQGADLCNSDISQGQIDSAITDGTTTLPDGTAAPIDEPDCGLNSGDASPPSPRTVDSRLRRLTNRRGGR
jgi:hypothetical protein